MCIRMVFFVEFVCCHWAWKTPVVANKIVNRKLEKIVANIQQYKTLSKQKHLQKLDTLVRSR